MRLVVWLLAVWMIGVGPSPAAPAKDLLQDLLTEAADGRDGTQIVLLIEDPVTSVVASIGGADAQTRFYLASVGKTMVAVAILDAVAAGGLSLDAPVGDLVTGLPLGEAAASRTLRSLLDHSSGLPDYLDDAFVERQFDRPTHRFTVAEALAHADVDETRAEGEAFAYSNTNYVLLGHILAQIDGSLETAMQRRVFGPAGMTGASVGARPGPGLARGIDQDGTDISAVLWNSTLGDGPVVASAADVSGFVHALFDTTALLPPALRADMLREGVAGSGYGLGIGVDGDAFGDWYGHTGGYEGATAEFRYYPDGQVRFVLIANTDLDLDWVMDAAVALWFEE